MSDEELIKQSLSLNSGMFLESGVLDQINTQQKFFAERNFTYTFNNSGVNEQNDIDVIASHADSRESKLLLSIECKREYNANKYWIFEDNLDFKGAMPDLLCANPSLNSDITKGHIDYGFRMSFTRTLGLALNQMKYFTNVIDFDLIGRDAKKSKLLGNAVPYKALSQANAAATGLAQNFTTLPYPHYVQGQKLFLLPIVVTTANLRKVAYDEKHISLLAGAIHTDKLRLEELKWAPFLYTLPYPMQLDGSYGKKRIRPARRLCFIVQAVHLLEFTSSITDDFDNYYEPIPSSRLE